GGGGPGGVAAGGGSARRTGRRVVTCARAAREMARAGSGTATTGARSMTARTAGSSASSAGSSVSASVVSDSIVVMASSSLRWGARRKPPTGADRGSRARSEGTAALRASVPAEPRPEADEILRRAPHPEVGADRAPVGQPPVVGPGILVGGAGCIEGDGGRRGGGRGAAREWVEGL